MNKHVVVDPYLTAFRAAGSATSRAQFFSSSSSDTGELSITSSAAADDLNPLLEIEASKDWIS